VFLKVKEVSEMKKLAGFTIFIVLLFAFSGIASAADQVWAGGYIEIDIDGNVLAGTFVTIHNPGSRGYNCAKLRVEVYDELGNIISGASLPPLKPKTAVTVSIASLVPLDFPVPFWKKLFLRFYWKRPVSTAAVYKYKYRPWLEVKQVVWETFYYEKAYFWLYPETFPILKPTLVRTWSECCRPFNPWYHYHTTWDQAP
jgi:hypothetical protein